MAKRKTPATGAPKGTKHPRAIFTVADISVIHTLAKDGWTQREIAEFMTEELHKRGTREKSDAIRYQTIGKILREERYNEE